MSLIAKDVIKRAMRMHGALASGADPDATEAADYLLAMNTLKRSMFGTLLVTACSGRRRGAGRARWVGPSI